MKNNLPVPNSAPRKVANPRSRWPWLLASGCALVILIGLLRRPHQDDSFGATASPNTAGAGGGGDGADIARARRPLRGSGSDPAFTAEEVVVRKLSQFARLRREYAHALAQRHGVEVTGDVERFFDAVESGNWDNIESAFRKINGGDSSAGYSDKRAPGVEHLWPAIIDAYGVAEQAHEWPAQKLLDYGNAVLGALRPGMVYVGGTDNGRWIPELLNDTSDGEHHIIVTQNALADSTYVDYLQLQYDERVAMLSSEDSGRAFKDYVADAGQRLRHDQEHPDEPKQLLPGEDVRMVDGKTEVSGQVAVMAINERLLQTLMAKNPDLSFALQESFPLKGTYADAAPLGPLMELRAQDGQNSFTAERASESVDYWRNTARQVLADPEASGSPAALKSYSHDATAAANLLAAHDFTGQAEQAYRVASQLWPGNPEPVGSLAGLLASNGREDEARRMVEEFGRKYPDQQKALERVSGTFRFVGPAPPPRP